MEDKLNLTTRNRCDTFAHLKISKPPFLFHIPVKNFGQRFSKASVALTSAAPPLRRSRTESCADRSWAEGVRG
jgi:hypothetical protein